MNEKNPDFKNIIDNTSSRMYLELALNIFKNLFGIRFKSKN